MSNNGRFWRGTRGWGATATLLLAAGFSSVEAQESDLTFNGQPAMEIGRFAAARVLEAIGPPLFGRREFYRPVPPL